MSHYFCMDACIGCDGDGTCNIGHYYYFLCVCLQLCDAVCHLFMTVSTDAGAETGLLSQDLQLSSLNHFSHFLSRSLLFDSDSGLEKEERRRLIESTRDELMQLEDHAAAGLKCLCDIFRKCFVKQEKQDKVLD